MNEENVIEKINVQIDADREILSVLPKNTKKNLQIYKDKANEIKQGYNNVLEQIVSEIKRRFIKIKSINADIKIETLANELRKLNKINLINKNTTSFEKMGLDEDLYILKRYYKNNLEYINDAIAKCIEKFSNVGVYLTYKDFNYSVYTKEYMKVFMHDMKIGNPNSSNVKDKFEQIYWKCPDIIIHLELNFRSLYLKKEKEINKYYENARKQVIKEIGLSESEILNKYNTLQESLIESKNKDTANILEKFLNNEKNAKDYEESNIKKCYKKLVEEDIQNLDKEQLDEINKNIYRLQNSLYEFKNYQKFKFVYDQAVDILRAKEKYKTIYTKKLKQIKKMETKLFKINKKIERYEAHKGIIIRFFSKNTNRLEKINIDANTNILEIRNIYRDLEENKINNIICSALNEGSTIYDVFFLVSNFYSFLVNTIINEFPESTQDEILNTITMFKKFINYPKTTIISNIKIAEDKDIILIIKDKYNLCNINITKEDLEEENLENLLVTVNNICDYNYLINSKTNLEDIKFILQAKKIIEEKQ